jgi:hypothetical protein
LFLIENSAIKTRDLQFKFEGVSVNSVMLGRGRVVESDSVVFGTWAVVWGVRDVEVFI